MNQRDAVAMPPDEVAAFLARGRKVQVATVDRDGAPHLVTMFYALRAGRITFWTYRASRKARNLARDPRVTCLVEEGEEYFDLRGVQVAGLARRIDDPAGVVAAGRAVAARLPGLPGQSLDDYVARAAPRRVAYLVEPHRIASWDHRRLLLT